MNTSIYKSQAGKAEILNYYNALRKDWPQPSEEIIVPTRFGDTFVICAGQSTAVPLVLLHGSGSNSALWKEDVKSYAKHFKVYSIDIIGECGKSSEERPAFADRNYSDWIREIFDVLGIRNASIVGCSLGGWIALEFAMNHPEKINKLVLLATAGITHVRPSTIFWLLITSFFGQWGFNKLNKMVYGELEIDQTALEFASLVKRHYKPRTDVLPLFTNEQLQQLVCPLYFIGGEHDCFYDSSKTAERLTKFVRSAKTDVRSNTGHVLIDQTKKIIEFLKE